MPQRRRTASLRIVSVVPAATEIVTALGAGDALVGVSHECLVADSASLPRVTRSILGASERAAEISAEVSSISGSGRPLFALLEGEIAALKPDVIVTQGLCAVCAVSEEDVRALAGRLSPTPRVVSLSASTLDGVFADIASVADALGAHTDAERLLSALRTRMKRVHVALSTARAPRPRVGVLEWTDPLFAAGHWVPEMIYRAGGSDVLAVSGQSSREVAWDTLTDASPEVLLVAPCGYDLERSAREARALLERRQWGEALAMWALDARRLVSQPGPGLVTGIETIAAVLHPGLFDPPSALRAVLVA